MNNVILSFRSGTWFVRDVVRGGLPRAKALDIMKAKAKEGQSVTVTDLSGRSETFIYGQDPYIDPKDTHIQTFEYGGYTWAYYVSDRCVTRKDGYVGIVFPQDEHGKYLWRVVDGFGGVLKAGNDEETQAEACEMVMVMIDGLLH